MKLAHLTEIAAIMAAHSQFFIEQTDEISSDAVGDYYVLSRNRFNRWMKDLDESVHGSAVHNPRRHRAELTAGSPPACSIMQQILINDIVARLWTVLLLARDANNGIDRVRPVAQNIYLGHMSVRHKALRVLLADDRATPNDLLAINQLRKSTERWTDLLCCSILGQFNLWEFAFDRERAMEFFRDRVDQGGLGHSNRAWVLILAGLRHHFQATAGLSAPIHDDDRQLVRLMLNCFPEVPEMTFWKNTDVHETKRC